MYEENKERPESNNGVWIFNMLTVVVERWQSFLNSRPRIFQESPTGLIGSTVRLEKIPFLCWDLMGL